MRFECGPHPYSAGTVRAPAQCGFLVTLETQNVNVKPGLSFFERCYVGNSRVDIRLEDNHNLIIPPFNH